MSSPERKVGYLTRDQVVIGTGSNASIPHHVRADDTVNWRCNHILPSGNQCSFRVVQYGSTDRIVDLGRDYPDAMFDHMWQEGHYMIGKYRPDPVPVDVVSADRELREVKEALAQALSAQPTRQQKAWWFLAGALVTGVAHLLISLI
jgi:hypothetical protein